jgi:hypothetical protein
VFEVQNRKSKFKKSKSLGNSKSLSKIGLPHLESFTDNLSVQAEEKTLLEPEAPTIRPADIVSSYRPAFRARPPVETHGYPVKGLANADVALYPNLAYKPDIDFEPIGMVSAIPALIVARKDFPPKDLKEFVSFVKANGDKLNVAHSGVGSVFFTTCMLLNSILNVKPTLVPFNGGGPAMNALVGGQVDYMCAACISLAKESGRTKACWPRCASW